MMLEVGRWGLSLPVDTIGLQQVAITIAQTEVDITIGILISKIHL